MGGGRGGLYEGGEGLELEYGLEGRWLQGGEVGQPWSGPIS